MRYCVEKVGYERVDFLKQSSRRCCKHENCIVHGMCRYFRGMAERKTENSKRISEKRNNRYESSGLVTFLECTLSMVASLFSVLLIRWLSEPIPGFTTLVLRWVGAAGIATLLGILLTGSYKIIRQWATIRTVYRLTGTVLLKELLLFLVIILGFLNLSLSKLTVLALLIDTLITFFMVFLLRFTGRVLDDGDSQRSIRDDVSRKSALIAGIDAESVDLASKIDAMPYFNVIGFVSADPNMAGRVIHDHIVYKCDSAEDLEELERRLGGVDCLFLPRHKDGFWQIPGEKTDHLEKESAKSSGKPIYDPMSFVGQFIKRSFDTVMSALLLLIFLPLGLVSALAIKIEDGGPVFFRQERIGRGGKPFNIIKFRSMRTDAESLGAQLSSGEQDPRLTHTGRFLRQHHLDELPQLWNVFRGDMSFIGYRPERQVFIDEIMKVNPRYCYLYQIRPGVTSYATLYNGYTDTMEKMLTRLDLDLYYLRNHSLAFDARVLGLTFLSIISGKKF